MSLLVVGSVAFDAVETPFGKQEKMLGGAATHFALSASFTQTCALSAWSAMISARRRSGFRRTQHRYNRP
jgi:hypothetical protein